MSDVTMRPPTGETMDIGDVAGPMAEVVITGSLRDAAGNAVSPVQGQTAYSHSQVTGNPHNTTAAGVNADPAGSAAAVAGSLSTHEGLSTTAHGGIVASTDARLSDARTPTAHKTSHEPGGADAMTVDAAAVTGSLRTLGTSATSACAGNDSRLSDARTPAAHAASHATAGGDAVAPSAIGAEPALGNPLVSGYALVSTTGGVRSWAATSADISAAAILLPTTSARNVIQPSGAAVVPLVAKAFAAQTADLQQWQDSAGAAMSLVGPTGNLGVGMATAPYRLSIQGTATNDSPILGAEFLAASPWTSTGWTGSWATGWIHTVGSSAALTFNTAPGGANSYKISYTVSGRTAGSFNLAIGGVIMLSKSVSGVWGPKTVSSAVFTVTPTSDFDGTIVFSIKEITGDSTPLCVLNDSTGAVVLSIRTNDGLGENTFVGYQAGARNIGKGNTAIGYSTGARHTGGSLNTLIGAYCGYSIGSGSGNVAIGYEAQFNQSAGQNNVAIGYGTMNKAVNSTSNIGIGFNALYNASGSYNVAIGQGSFQSLTSGTANTAIGGYSVGVAVTTGSYNVFVGTEADLGSSTQRSQAIAIGYQAKVDLSDACVIGRTGTTAPLLGLNTTTPGAQIHAIARTATTIGQITQGATSQTANLHEWRDSTPAVLVRVGPDGTVECPKVRLTPEGGIAVRVVAGEAIALGEIVYSRIAGGTDGKVWKNPIDGDMPIGVAYAAADADAALWIVTTGIASVLPNAADTAVRGYVIVSSSTTAGRVDQAASVPAAITHFRECGHWIDTGSGAGVATRAIVHFN